MSWENKSKNAVISLLAIRTQKSMLSYSLPHWNVLFAIVPAMSYDFCLIPRKQQLPKHQPISWTKAFGETQGPSSEHRAQIFQLISLTTEIANRWHNEKAVPGAWSAPQTQLQSRALLTKDKREKKAKEKKKSMLTKQNCPWVDLWLASEQVPFSRLLVQLWVAWTVGKICSHKHLADGFRFFPGAKHTQFPLKSAQSVGVQS